MKSGFTAHVPTSIKLLVIWRTFCAIIFFLDYKMDKSFPSLCRMRGTAVYKFWLKTFTLGWQYVNLFTYLLSQ